jgi:tetratricopeptide (TPR) repeat protein
LGNLGTFKIDRGELQEALDWYARAIRVLQPVLAAEPLHLLARQNLRNAHWGRAAALTRLQRFAEAEPDWTRALELADGAERSSIRMSRAESLARAGMHTRAVAEAAALVGAPDVTAEALYNAAGVYALAATAATTDAPAAARYAARATELLRQALARGYTDVAHLLRDGDLAPLRRRADYAALLWDLADAPAPRPADNR